MGLGHLGAVVEARVERQHCARRRDHPAAHREDPVHLAHGLLEVPSLEVDEGRQQQVADGMAAEARRRRLLVTRRRGVEDGAAADAREAVLEQLAHQRLGVGERDDAVADVAHGRDAELGAEHARRAAVVRHRDDRREVGRVLLEPAQERREARPAAHRDDAWPAREEPLLVDDLDHRQLPVPERERVHERTHEAIAADANRIAPSVPRIRPRSS